MGRRPKPEHVGPRGMAVKAGTETPNPGLASIVLRVVLRVSLVLSFVPEVFSLRCITFYHMTIKFFPILSTAAVFRGDSFSLLPSD